MVDLNRVDDAHRATWNSAVRFGRNAVFATIIALVLMAIFLL